MTVTRFQGQHTLTASGATVIDRTSPLQMDGLISIGQYNVSLNNSYLLTAATLTENAAGGDVSINVAAGQNAVIGLIADDYFKEITSFLSTSSVPPVDANGNYADNSGDAPLSKGAAIISFGIAYSVQGGSLSSIAFRADLNWLRGGGLANAITSVVANGQNGLPLTATASATTVANSKVQSVLTFPTFDDKDNAHLYLRLNPVTPGGVTFRLYGVTINCAFNYL